MYYLTQSIPKGGGGVLPYKRLMGCAAGCGRIFTTGLTIMGSHIFEFLGIRHLFSIYVRLANVPECLHCRRKVKCSSFNLKHGSIHKNRKWLSWDRGNYIFAQRWRGWGLQLATEYRLLQWGRGSERPAAHTQQKLTQVSPPPLSQYRALWSIDY